MATLIDIPIMYDTLWELFDEVGSAYNFEVPMITGGISYGETRKFDFELPKNKWVHCSVTRLDSGKYELTHYLIIQ